MPTLSPWQFIVLAFDYSHPVRIITGTVNMGVLNSDARSSHSEYVAGGVKNASPYKHIFDVYTGNTIVTCFEKAVLNKCILGAMKMNSVRSSKAGNPAHHEILAIIGFVQKITAMPCYIALQ